MTSQGSHRPHTNGRAWAPWLKGALSLGLLALVVWHVPVARAADHLRQISPLGILAAASLTLASPAVAAWRWKRVLARSQVHVPWFQLIADLLVAATYNLLLPTSIGGDVVRAARCAKRIPRANLAWSSVLYERLLGVFGLGLLAVPGMALVPGLPRQLSWWLGGVMLSVGLAVVVAHAPFRILSRFLARRAPKAAGFGDALADDFAGPMSSWGTRLETLAWSMAYQLTALSVIGVVALDWGHPQWLLFILAAVPLALIVTLLPISIAGLGVRESMFVLLLGQLGMSSGRALSLAMIWLLSSLLLAAAGSLVLLLETRRPRGPA